jgi:hypothetical protein
MVGGMITSTLLTLVVIPPIYLIWRRRQLRRRPGRALLEALRDRLALGPRGWTEWRR